MWTCSFVTCENLRPINLIHMRILHHTVKYVFLVALLLLLFAVLHLKIHGFPDKITKMFINRIQLNGMIISVDNIKLSVFEGLIANHICCNKKKVVGSPLFEADRVVLHIAPAPWFKGKSGLVSATMNNGTVRLRINSQDRMYATDSNMLVFEKVDANLKFDLPRLIRVTDFSATLLSAQIIGRGDLVMDAGQSAEDISKPAKRGVGFEDAGVHMDISQLIQLLNMILAGNAIRADVNFLCDPSDIQKLDIQMNIVARNKYAKQKPAGSWHAMIGIKGNSGNGILNMKNCYMHGVWSEKALGLFRFDETNFCIKQLDAVLGSGSWQGPLNFSVNYQRDTQQYRGEISCEFAPQVFLVLLKDLNLPHASYVQSLKFDNVLPACTADFNGTIGSHPHFQANGQIQASDFSYNGVSNVYMDSSFLIDFSKTNKTITFSPLRVDRQEGCVAGAADVNLDSQTIEFRALSSSDPGAVATMIGPFLAQITGLFRIDGPVKMMASGIAGYRDMEKNDIDIAIDAQKLGWEKLLFDQCLLSIKVIGDSVDLTDIQCSAYGGDIQASASLYPVLGVNDMRYEVKAMVDGVDFEMLTHAIANTDESIYHGKLSADFYIEGFAGNGNSSSVNGYGQINIYDGHLFQIPLFGGLSDILTKIIPGLSFVLCQTDASASVIIQDGKIHSDDILIEGDIFSLQAKGDCYFDGRLDVSVYFTLLRKHTLAGEVLRIITLPISMMLEFHLGGTIQSPQWRPARLPKEMFLTFQT